MLITRGIGALGAVYGLLAAMIFGAIGSIFFTDDQLPFSVGTGFILAAVATWFTGRQVNRIRPARNGGAFNQHTLFWIPLQYFSIVWIGLAGFAVVYGITNA